METEKKILTSKACFDNKLKIINEEYARKDVYIQRPAISRTGLAFIGFLNENDISKNVIGWGTIESNWMDKQTKKDLVKIIQSIFILNPPLVICSTGMNEKNKKIILEIANKNKVPLCFPELKTSFINTTLGVYLSSFFAQTEFIHGSLIIINGVGVLIIGKSGIGKSEIILDLLHKNHVFVSDDAVIVKKVGNSFFGESPEITQDLLEARGLGLMNICSIYGTKAIRKTTQIDLVIELDLLDSSSSFDRLGNKNLYYSILNGKINKIKIPITPGRNASSLVEAATYLYITKQYGEDVIDLIEKRTKKEEEK
ncbi:MAG: HPr(Ser) kinase/phosphatase [Metamycoplasmataceae bacterium]